MAGKRARYDMPVEVVATAGGDVPARRVPNAATAPARPCRTVHVQHIGVVLHKISSKPAVSPSLPGPSSSGGSEPTRRQTADRAEFRIVTPLEEVNRGLPRSARRLTKARGETNLSDRVGDGPSLRLTQPCVSQDPDGGERVSVQEVARLGVFEICRGDHLGGQPRLHVRGPEDPGKAGARRFGGLGERRHSGRVVTEGAANADEVERIIWDVLFEHPMIVSYMSDKLPHWFPAGQATSSRCDSFERPAHMPSCMPRFIPATPRQL